jgi:hypothetical protein
MNHDIKDMASKSLGQVSGDGFVLAIVLRIDAYAAIQSRADKKSQLAPFRDLLYSALDIATFVASDVNRAVEGAHDG